MSVFIIVPLILILVFAFTTTVKFDNTGNRLTNDQAAELIADWEASGKAGDFPVKEKFYFTFDNIIQVGNYSSTLINSVILASIATVICLFLGYPFAYMVSRMRVSRQKIMIMFIMLPMWMNFLLRTYAWMTLLEKNGWINRFLELFGIGPFEMINTQGAVVLGMIYNFLPYMILPLYSVMTKIDDHTIEAAYDLGANRVKALTKVILPLSMPGIASGITMVFVPAVSTFIISKLLGGGTNMLIGDLIELQFLGNTYNPHLGSAISLVLLVFVLLCISVTNQLDSDKTEGVLL
ncbi:MAG: ABC transporter permease [Clostridiales bacterium]|nr:ABC transporter permease [Clostridiales bacterium]